MVHEPVLAGHKIVTRAMAVGAAMHRYNQIIGTARQDIAAGEYVHVHNLGMAEFTRDYAFSEDSTPTNFVLNPASFRGIVRPDGRVATRNYFGILVSLNCSATVAARSPIISVATDGRRSWPITRTSMVSSS